MPYGNEPAVHLAWAFGLATCLATASCDASRPDWAELLEERFGREVASFDEVTFNSPWEGEGGTLTRAAWVKWKGQMEMDFLGLPPYGLETLEGPRAVVAKIDPLPAEQWQEWMRRAMGDKVRLKGWSIAHKHPGDAIIVEVHATLVEHEDERTGAILPTVSGSNPGRPRCEFIYTPSGWEMRKCLTIGRDGRPVDDGPVRRRTESS